MRTRWGTCNTDAGRIWLNLELAKKPPECLEYIVVHEMVHLIERLHNDNFKAHMDRAHAAVAPASRHAQRSTARPRELGLLRGTIFGRRMLLVRRDRLQRPGRS